jgi:phosphoribosylpyrophosphate synthetase
MLPLAALLAVGACLTPGPATGAGGNAAAAAAAVAASLAADAGMVALIDEYTADARSVDRFYAIGLSPTRLDRQDALAATWRERLDAVDFDALGRDGRVDWLLLSNALEHGIKERAARRAKLDECAPLLPFADTITGLEEPRWTLAAVDPEQAAQTLDALAKSVKAAREESAIVLDDVYTTGATANEIAKTLKRAGTRRVELLTVARVPLQGEG